MNNVLQFRPRADQVTHPETPDARSVTSPDPAAQDLLGSLSAMFRAAGCPGLAEAFVEAGGGRG